MLSPAALPGLCHDSNLPGGAAASVEPRRCQPPDLLRPVSGL